MIHVHCTGEGGPTVVVEYGLGDFSFDWVLVQERVSAFSRICVYDRAGYAWSEPGPMPRTFAQLNWELRAALARVRAEGPFVLVGHSFGGPVARNFALTHPGDVVGMVFVDAAQEDQRVRIQGKAVRLRDGARGLPIPAPRSEPTDQRRPPEPRSTGEPARPLDPLYRALPQREQELHIWAQARAELDAAEQSQREWSTEYFARWHATPQAGSLGAIPVIVLAREKGGYADLDLPAEQIENERRHGQAQLARLSRSGKLVWVKSGHNMHLEAPDQVTAAIREIVAACRKNE
jgi:pimeloyl-ACP methyl ester carboxylesterase